MSTSPSSSELPPSVSNESSQSQTEPTTSEPEPLPKLSAADFKAYNKLAVMMEYYHNHFRHEWTILYTACENNKRPHNIPLSSFLNIGLQLVSHLNAHHGIEEAHIFPVLATRMPEFKHHSPSTPSSETNPTAALMTAQHKLIHAGLDRLEAYLSDSKRGIRDFRLQGEGSLKEVMDTFRDILWTHLDEEVRLLGAENMRKFWSKEELARMNW